MLFRTYLRSASFKSNRFIRIGYSVTGLASLLLGIIGAAVPLLPTVPFIILAAFCFARSNPRWEAWLLEHPKYGVHIRNWRERGVISPQGKLAAFTAFGISSIAGLFFLNFPWVLIPLVVAVLGSIWIGTRPSR
jgi:uncharacterized protein